MIRHLAPPIRALEDLILAVLIAITAMAVALATKASPTTIDGIAIITVAALVLLAATRWPKATRWLVATAFILTLSILHATAYADATTTVHGNHVVTVDVAILSAFIGTWIPLLTAWITKARAASHVKAIANLVLSVLGTLAAVLITNGGSMSVQDLAIGFMLTYGASGTTYQHFWKPVGTATRISEATRLLGFG